MGELAAASKVHVMVSHWWSRGDGLANHQLGQILTRAAGVGQVDLTDPQSIDRALRIAVADPAVLAELEQWWQMVETRRAGNGTPQPGSGSGSVDSVPGPYPRLVDTGGGLRGGC
ncbi:hypothetical protein ACFFI2_11935, partial [Rhodococcus jostii]